MLDKLVMDALKEACNRAGSQLKLAKQTGLSQGQISDYLCGRRDVSNMTVGTLEKIFPLIQIIFFPDAVNIDSTENEIVSIIHRMNKEEKVRCLKILAAYFPDKIGEVKFEEK